MRLRYRLGLFTIWTVPERKFKFFRYQTFMNLSGCLIYAQNKEELIFLEMFFKGQGYEVIYYRKKSGVSADTYCGFKLYLDEHIYVNGKLENLLETFKLLRKHDFRTCYQIQGNQDLYIVK